MPLVEESKSFVASLEQKSERSRKNARKNYRTAYGCNFLAIAASFAATIMAASSSTPGSAVAIVTAIPGAALLLSNVFAFYQKANWHRRKKMRYDALALQIEYESKPIADAAKELRMFEEEMEKQYPGFGAFPRQQNGT